MKRDLWKEDYRLGVDRLDDDHMNICRLMERFLEAIDDKLDHAAVTPVFQELRAALDSHFEREKRFLETTNCPAETIREHLDGHLDVTFALDHAFQKWDQAAHGTPATGGLPAMCMWVWQELIQADKALMARMDAAR